MDVFDAVLLVTKGRFTEFDLAMFNLCKDKNVPCFLVRTKFDLSVTADQEDNELDAPDVVGCMARVRANIVEHVGEASAHRIFVVCGKLSKMGMYDMPSLLHAVLHATASSRFGRRAAGEGESKVAAT